MRGVYLEAELLHSEAFRSLSRWCHLVYLRFLEKRVLVKEKHKSKADTFRISNNGQIIFPYREAGAMGINEKNFRDSIDALQRVGLIDIARYGKGGRSGESTLYWIDTRWRHYGSELFQPPKNPRIKDTRQGRNGFAAYNAERKKRAVENGSGCAVISGSSLDQNQHKRLTKSTVIESDENRLTFRYAD